MKAVIIKRGWILLIVLTIPLVLGLPLLKKESGLDALLPGDHPDFVFFEEMEEVFGASDQIVMALTLKESLFKEDNLRLLQRVTEAFVSNPYIKEEDVLSLATVDNIVGDQGMLQVGPLMEEGKRDWSSQEILDLRQAIWDNPLYLGKLISQDGKSFVVLASLNSDLTLKGDVMASIGNYVYQLARDIRKSNPEVEVNVSGMPILKYVISDYMDRDMGRLFPLAILVVALLLYLFLRNWFGTFIPLIVTAFAVVWTFGLKGWIGSPVTIAETTIPIMLIAIGCADGVHMISEFFHFIQKGYSRQEGIKKTLESLRLPILLTSITTSMGFISLIAAPGLSIKNMGLFLAIGVLLAMVFTLVLIPAFLRVIPMGGLTSGTRKEGFTPWEERAAVGITFILKRGKTILVGAALVMFLSLLAVFQVRVESDDINYFKDQVPIKKATQRIQDTMGGVASLDIILETPEAGGMKDPQVLAGIERIQEYCQGREDVGYTLALTDYIKQIRYQVFDRDPREFRLPQETELVGTRAIEGQNQVANLLLLYELGGGDVLDSFVDSDYKRGKITVRMKDSTSRDLVNGVIQVAKESLPKGVDIRFTNQYTRIIMSEVIVQSQIISYALSLLSILVLMAILFRSLKAGVLVTIPVMAAVSLNFAVMWVLGISLNIGTSIIAAVGMGVGVDYGIHFFTRFRRDFRESKDYEGAVITAFIGTSKAVVFNAFAVGTGFLVLLLSQYKIIAHMGWIISLSMFTTAWGALVVLPVLLVKFPLSKATLLKKRFTKKEIEI